MPEGHHEGERGAVLARQLAEVVLEQLHQPVPEQGGVRQLRPGLRVQPALADPSWAGERLERLLQQVRVQGGQPEPSLAGAVPAVVEREVGERPGPGFFLLELRALGGVGRLGADHLEQPLAQPPEGGGVEDLGLLEQVRLGPHLGPGRQVVVLGRQPLHGVGDDARLLHVDHPGRERGPGPVEPGVELGREVQVAVTARGAGPGRVREPGRGADGSGVGADVVAVGLHQHPQLELVEPVALPAQLHQRLPLFGSGHRPGRSLGEPVQRTRQRGGEPQHRVSRGRLPDGRRRRCGHRGHAATLRDQHPPALEGDVELWMTRARRGCGRHLARR